MIDLKEFNRTFKSAIEIRQTVSTDDYLITLDDLKADIKDAKYINVDLIAHFSMKSKSGGRTTCDM